MKGFWLVSICCLGLLITGCDNADSTQPLGPLNKVVYVCERDFGQQICIVDVDGRDQKQLTQIFSIPDEDPQLADNLNNHPDMNRAGQIAFTCTRNDTLNAGGQQVSLPSGGICVINADGTGFARITEEPLVQNLAIGEDGVVYYDCADELGRFTLCRISFDGTSKTFLLPDSQEGFTPDVNASGDVVFTCVPQGAAILKANMEICAIDSDGNNFSQLTDDELINRMATINDAGIILYACDAPNESSYGLCKINADGSGLDHIIENSLIPTRSSLNNKNNYIYACLDPDAEPRHLCAQEMGEIPHKIFGPANSAATINDADRIAYVCNEDEICVMNFEGAGKQQITEDAKAVGTPIAR